MIEEIITAGYIIEAGKEVVEDLTKKENRKRRNRAEDEAAYEEENKKKDSGDIIDWLDKHVM